MSRCAGAGREHSQADNPSRAMEIFHTVDGMLNLKMRVSQGAGTLSSILFWEFNIFCEFKLFQEFGVFPCILQVPQKL